jgi:CubicO group peptidase (beta-lactamase class C family)
LHDAETCDGPLWPADSYGHTGFTGTSAWHSPSLDLTAIVLSNRVYHGRDRTAEKITSFRLAFHGSLVEGLS